MKWLAFTAACAVILVLLGILAVDERDVVWEGRKAICPYCRSDLEYYALLCKACDRTLDWTSHREPCRTCLKEEDVKHMRDGFDALALKDTEPLPEALAGFPKAYFLAMETGACTYCAGIKKVMKDGLEVDCSVCRGSGRCVACGGDSVVVIGDANAHDRKFAREREWREELRRAQLTRLTLLRGQLVNEDVAALRGFVEIEDTRDEQGRKLLDLARDRVKAAFKAIHAAVEERGRRGPAATTAPSGS